MCLRPGAARLIICLFAAALSTACAARGFTPPTDPGSPLADVQGIHAGLFAACTGVRTFTAELGLSGRVGSERVRGRVVAGFMRPDSMRLEGVAPIGPPAFILATRDGAATLVLPRDNAAISGSPPAQLLEALTGVLLQPQELQDVLTGCVGSSQPTGGRLHGDGSASIDTAAGATLYLRRAGAAWQLRSATREQWIIEYPAWQGRFPASVRLRSSGAGVAVDIAATIGQLEANVDLDAAAFEVTIPGDAVRVSLDELRRAGPLRGQP